MSDTTTSPTAAGITRRTVLKAAGAAFGLYFVGVLDGRPWVLEAAAGEVAAGFLDPLSVPKWVTPLLVPPVMPTTGRTTLRGGKNADLYDIAVRQISQQVLPAPLPPTTLWAYGPTSARKGKAALLFHAPSATIEAKWQRPVRVTWRNELVDADGRFLPHLLPIDPTLHWANPPGGTTDRDSRPVFAATPEPYRGPVPVVTHVHGAVGVGDESDGYPEAWYLPDAVDLPAGHAHDGTWYAFFRSKAEKAHGLAWPTGGSDLPLPRRPARLHALVPRPHPGDDARERLRRTRRLLPAAGRAKRRRRCHRLADRAARGATWARTSRRRTGSPAASSTARFRSRSRTARSSRTGRSSIQTPASTSTAPWARTCPRVTSRRSGTPSSSATRSWSTATPGRRTPSSSADTGSVCSTAATRDSSSSTSASPVPRRGRSEPRVASSPRR